MQLPDRYRGALLGLAVGDALGTTLEFKRPKMRDVLDYVDLPKDRREGKRGGNE